MTTQEFSDEFDTILNSYIVSNAFGQVDNPLSFDEYEKSVFLTKAQEEVVITIYSGRNNLGLSFESTEEARKYLDNIVKTKYDVEKLEEKGLTTKSYIYKLPQDLWFIIYEDVTIDDTKIGCANKENISVIPITHDEYHRIKENPFRRANKRKVLRLDLADNLTELISEYNISAYNIRYLAHPSPIILEDLPENLKINNENKAQTCVLNSSIHKMILDRAVALAIASRSHK